MARPLPPPCPACGYPLTPFDPDTGYPEHCPRCAEPGETAVGAPLHRPAIAAFLDGFTSLFRAAFALLGRREYRGKFALAVVANFVLLVLLFGGLVWGLHLLIGQIEWSGWWAWVDEAGDILSWPLALLATWFLAPAVINLGMTPFFDALANAAEKIEGGEKLQPVSIGIHRNVAAAVNATVQILILQIFILVPVLVLSLIPLVGPLFVIGGALFSAYLNALVWFEIPVVRRGYGFRYRRQLVGENVPRALGIGLAFHAGLLVPLFNIFFLGPAAAVAVSSQYFRCEKITRDLRAP